MGNLYKRIKAIREKMGYSQSKMATAMGIGARTYSRYETGEREPSAILISNIARLGNISADWLLFGKTSEENAFQDNYISIPYFKDTYATAGDGAINYEESSAIMNFDEAFLKSQLGINTSFKGIHIINSFGTSMQPTINPNELLFVLPFENENCTIKDDGIYVLTTPQGVLVKRINLHPTKKMLTLVSDNPTKENIILGGGELDSCKIIGRVIGHFAGV